MTRNLTTPIAFAAAALAAALAAWGTFGDEDYGWGEFAVVCGIIAVATVAVFGWAVPRWLDSPAVGVTALVLSFLGVLSIAAFWTGLPPVLAAGGALLGWAARDRTAGKLAMAIGVLALVADLAVYVLDMT